MKVVLTGPPGIGKTTLVKKVVERIKDKAIGFWTEEVRDKVKKERTGFRIVSTDKKSIIFASKFFTSKYLVGSYGVNVERFESVALPILERALKEKDKIVVIDEVGKMELFSEKFANMVSLLLSDTKRSMLITIPIRDVHPLVKWIRRHPQVVLMELKKENRDALPEEIVNLLLQDYRT
ncbi:MAG: NTPase [Hydrogenobacter sp.]